MQISALGHSCVLLDLAIGDPRSHTRILVDPWLSDHATGDAMGRFPRVRFEAAQLAPIHAVYLSHAHCDHLDPYTLVRLWQALPEPPVLLLPVSLAFLVHVFHAHLPGVEIRLLIPNQPQRFRGVQVLGLYDPAVEPTNEEDVMVLVVTCGTERVLIEADARLSLELPELRQTVAMLLGAPGLDSAVWLTTENELTGTMLGRTCASVEERAEVVELAQEELLQHVDQLYQPPEDPDEWSAGVQFDEEMPSDPWQLPHLLRLVHGQGLTVPHEQDGRWQRVLFPVRVRDRVDVERAVAAQRGCRHQIDALEPGQVYTVRAGRVTEVCPLSGVELLDTEDARVFELELPFFPALPCAPIWPDARDRDAQKVRVEALLRDRYLPYLHGLRMPPVLQLLAAHDGAYRVRVHFGTRIDEDVVDYVLGYEQHDFVPQPASDEDPAEAYWAHDLEDMLDGRCDEFSPTCRAELPADNLRLWTSLASPMLNRDLVLRRVEHHFDRASAGRTAADWVRAMWAPCAGEDERRADSVLAGLGPRR